MRLALLEEPVHQGAGQGRLAAPGEAGEEQDQALLGRGGAVDVDDLRRLGRVGLGSPAGADQPARTGSGPA